MSRQNLVVSENMISEYVEALSSQGKSEDTIRNYRYNLKHMYQLLPEDKIISDGTLEKLREYLLAGGYSMNTVNTFTSSVNGFLAFCEHAEFQVFDTLKNQKNNKPMLDKGQLLGN